LCFVWASVVGCLSPRGVHHPPVTVHAVAGCSYAAKTCLTTSND
jgi:hypothetical protein